jgi:hypothetical protein
LIATNTIAQGDTRETGLDYIISKGGTIYSAYSSLSWPGLAAVYVSVVHVRKGGYLGDRDLNDLIVESISSALDSVQALGKPKVLSQNSDKSFKGSAISGLGFTISPEEAEHAISDEPRNRDVLFPFLNGYDLNSSPAQSPSRWVINFFDWPLERAQEYRSCYDIVFKEVFPERQKHSNKKLRDNWWLYERARENLYQSIKSFERVLAIAQTSRTQAFAFVPRKMVFSNTLIVIASDRYSMFATLQSSVHNVWVHKYASSLKEDIRYIPTDCFETFPFPEPLLSDGVTYSATRATLDAIGEQYHEHRRQIMLARQEGLTTTYNRFHDADERSADIARLRDLHVEMDRAVAAAYGWEDLALGHDFHQTQQGVRFTLSETARREVLGRLLELNHQRWEEEQKAKDEGGGMKAEVKKKAKGRKKKSGGDEGGSQMGLL